MIRRLVVLAGLVVLAVCFLVALVVGLPVLVVAVLWDRLRAAVGPIRVRWRRRSTDAVFAEIVTRNPELAAYGRWLSELYVVPADDTSVNH